MRAPWKTAASLALLALTAIGCDGILGITVLPPGAGADASSDAPGGDAGTGPAIFPVRTSVVGKVDLLFMIDNSASMGDKQFLLYLAVPQLVQRLVDPDCVDSTTGQPTGMIADANGTCPAGSRPQFAPVHDLHIGIVTSSLGGRGGDQCPDNATNPANTSLPAHTNDKGELINRGGMASTPTVETGMPDETAPDNFLAWFPGCTATVSGMQCTSGPNAGQTVPNNAVTSGTNLVNDFETAVLGVHEHGCGFEAQNEAWYRFLVQPDPFANIGKSSNEQAQLSGIDTTILEQRADFLRPDSLLAVIVVTDENEEAADPLSIGAQGWALDNSAFPSSPDMAAPEGTIECALLDPMHPSTTGPNDPKCTSCAFILNSPNFSAECPNDPPGGTGGFLDPSDDALNVRFFHQKERFGFFAGYPTSRYVAGLQSANVPSVGLAFPGDKDHEHDSAGNYVGDQPAQQNCVNPIYAQNLPKSASGNLCTLERGPRTPDLVYYGAIAGVPHQFLQSMPGDGTCPAGTQASECPQKPALTDADWKLILGNDPEHYDFSGADFHMIESTQERTTTTTDHSSSVWANHSNCPDTAADNCDPINGREVATDKFDLQFSCIFPLITVSNGTVEAFQKDCTTPGPGDPYKGACDCAPGSLDANTQLCMKNGSAYTQVQVNGKAYPPVREMIIAKAMSKSAAGNQGIVSSICPINTDIGMQVTQAQADPLFGLNPGMNAIVDRIKGPLQGLNCLARPLPTNPVGTTCTMIAALASPLMDGGCKSPGSACSAAKLKTPAQPLLDSYCDAQEQAYLAAGGTAGGKGDPSRQPACQVPLLTPSMNASDFTNGSCATGTDPGWCYVTGSAASPCAQTVFFTSGQPPAGSSVTLVCPGVSQDAGP